MVTNPECIDGDSLFCSRCGIRLIEDERGSCEPCNIQYRLGLKLRTDEQRALDNQEIDRLRKARDDHWAQKEEEQYLNEKYNEEHGFNR